jgi:hypothetical protein
LASGHTVTAEFQEASGASPDAIDWKTLGTATVLAPSASFGTTTTHQATLTFPSWLASTSAKHRVLVREYEVYGADDQSGVRQGTGIVHIGDTTQNPYAQRLVYADAIGI